MQYKVTKIGLLNFWLYDEEEFEFSDGKLLLRGENGSGKSVTMQSFIPLILDGNKSPSRLDPFGSNDKHIEDYLLGGIDTEKKDEATGYLYMETYLESKQKYITIGMGLHAKRGRPVDFWGFALLDGRRIGKDFFLYKNKVPYSKNELRLALGTENKLVETTKEYKKMVNHLLFGFPNLDTYDEFINVLLQLRSPKLSKEYKPTKLMNILNGVLQPLSEEDLRPLSDAVEEMDKTQDKIETLEKDAKQLSYLLKSYSNYNEIVLYKKAERYLMSVKEEADTTKTIESKENQRIELSNQLEKNKKQKEKLQLELESVQNQKEHLNSTDLNYKVKRLEELKRETEKKEQEKNNLEIEHQKKQEKRIETEHEVALLQNEIDKIEREKKELKEDIVTICEQIKFYHFTIKEPIQFEELFYQLNNYQKNIAQLKKILEHMREKEERLSESELNYDGVKKEYQNQLSELEKIEDNASDALQELKDQISLLQQNKQIKIQEDEKKQMINVIKEYNKSNYEKAKTIYLTIAEHYEKQMRDEQYSCMNKISRTKEKITELTDILEALQNKQEEEIEYDMEVKETELFLKEKNIPYIPFYKAIEFKESVTEETKNKLESVLLESGLLSSFILSDKDVIKNHKGFYVTPGTKKKDNLSYYFDVSKETLMKETVKKVLESISIDKNDICFFNEEGYKIDSFIGYGSKKERSKYIGILARIREQKRKIEDQQNKIKSETLLLEQYQQEKEEKEQFLKEIIEEKKSFPKNDSLEKLLEKQKEYEIRIEEKQKEILKIEEQISKIKKEMDRLFQEMNPIKQEVDLPITLESISTALDDIQVLEETIRNLEKSVVKIEQKEEMKQIKQDQLEDTVTTIETLLEQIHDAIVMITKTKQEQDDLEQILNTEEYRDLTEKLKIINEKLYKIPLTLDQLTETIGREKTDYSNLILQKEEMEKELVQKQTISKLREELFTKEYRLGYVLKEEGEPISMARKTVKLLEHRKNTDLSNAQINYYEAYNNYRVILGDYRLSNITLFSEIVEGPLKPFYEEGKRLDFRVFYQGKQITLYELEKSLSEAIEENNQIFGEQDRKIFQEILLKTVGTKIRDRINSSKEWVRKINDILKQQSSKLTFQLEWHSKDRESIEELDTRELVRLFKMDTDQILPKDSENLIQHFRSKVKKKLELASVTHDSYSSIIFEILDYRNWFEFRMFYQRAGENRKELTDKVFSVFSGGEKAKTMYLPLFTAICAKLDGAFPNALRLVALDEAFAGVDDTNIREMFGIMSSLKLDYILTSQALWGDFDTISDLGIAELIKPSNSSVVLVRRYHWNGKVKEVLLKGKENVIRLF